MREELRSQINENIIKLNPTINRNWFIRFFDMLDVCGVAEEKIEKAVCLFFDEVNVKNTAVSHKMLMNGSKNQVIIDNFYNYIKSIIARDGADNFRDFLERTIDQMEVDYQNYEDIHHGTSYKKTNYTMLFLRNLALDYSQDVRLESQGVPMKNLQVNGSCGVIQATIGGAEIGHLHFEEVDSNQPHIQFTEFRTMPGLEKMGLGSYMFLEFCRQIDEFKPGYATVAWSVKKGKDGSKAYSAWGGYPIDATFVNETDYWDLDTKGLTQEQIDAYEGQMLYYFPPEQVKKLASLPNNIYGSMPDLGNSPNQ